MDDATFTQLGPRSLALLLKSDALKLHSENSTFAFVLLWFENVAFQCKSRGDRTTSEVIKECIREVLESLRYTCFSPHYLWVVWAATGAAPWRPWCKLPDGTALVDDEIAEVRTSSHAL